MATNPCRKGNPYGTTLAPLMIALAWLGTSLLASAQVVTIALTQIGNPNNPVDATGLGAVGSIYDIGTYDVTVSQYAAFLNSVAKTADPYGLYDPSMANIGNFPGNTTNAGISQVLASGTFSYQVVGGAGQDPMSNVTWLDAARFCNWLQNGQPVGLGETASSTESGAYLLTGDTSSGLEARSLGATWFLPSPDEWYKAAFYDPSLNGTGGYWSYATQSDTVPGNVPGSAPNQANFHNTDFDSGYPGTYSATGSTVLSATQNYLTATGTFSGSASAYGTYDQNGDAYQWTEGVSGSNRSIYGGAWDSLGASQLASTGTNSENPVTEDDGIGFRVAAAAVPEPGTVPALLAGVAVLGGLGWRRRRS